MRARDAYVLAGHIRRTLDVLRCTLAHELSEAAVDRLGQELALSLVTALYDDNPRIDPGAFLGECGYPAAGSVYLGPETRAMAQAYAGGMSLAEVGKKHGISGSAVGWRLRAAGITLRPPGRYRRKAA